MCIILLRVTPTANRNSYRVAMIGGVDTQGSVLRPQSWAGESQLLESCQGAPLHPSPRGGSSYLLCFRVFEWLLPLGEGWDGAPVLAGTHPRQYFPHYYTLLYIYQGGVLCPQTWTWETLPYNLSATHYTSPATFVLASPLLTTISHTASISVLAKAVSLRAGIGSRMVMMTQKIVEEKCIDITIMLKCKENDNEI